MAIPAVDAKYDGGDDIDADAAPGPCGYDAGAPCRTRPNVAMRTILYLFTCVYRILGVH